MKNSFELPIQTNSPEVSGLGTEHSGNSSEFAVPQKLTLMHSEAQRTGIRPPLLSPKEFAAYAPEEFQNYVRSLFRDPKIKLRRKLPQAPKPPKLSKCGIRVNTKGTVILTTKRKPKWVSREQLESFAGEQGLKLIPLWNLAVEKGFEVLKSESEGHAKEASRE